MCGICGYISNRPITKEQLCAMNDTMKERGPDDAGAELWQLPGEKTLGMAQRRLSILDLSSMGHQPMSDGNSRVSLVFNGEIYNYREIKRELSDYPFRSNCDTEVILAAYLKWGIDCISRFNGMFAIALYDRERKELFLVRDRIGQKPLYYWLDDGNIVFASVLAPIMECPGFHKRIRRDVLPRYLYQEYIPAPETIFEDVYKVEPGTILSYSLRENRIEKRVYWDVANMYRRMQDERITDFEEAKTQLKDLLRQAVQRRMISDVPLGTFLSGGYDSSLITALASEQGNGTPLETFSIGFEDPAYDESLYARAISEHLGTKHTECIISTQDMLELVADLPHWFDEPLADSSQIPTMLVSKLARQKVTVALSGDAGDEFFCGYSIYDLVGRAQRLDRLGSAAHAIGRVPLGRGRRLEDLYPFRVHVISANRDPRTKTQFGVGSYVKLARDLVLPCDTQFLSVNFETEQEYPSENWQIRRMLLDMDTYLPEDILSKVDRASMKYSLENRCPFLDPEVMAFSYRMDHDFKYHREENGGFSKKYILKSIAWDYIPKELLERPKKGFSVPLSDWLRGPLREEFLSYTDEKFLREQGFFDADRVRALSETFLKEGDAGSGSGRNYSKLLWSFFVFQQWARYWNV